MDLIGELRGIMEEDEKCKESREFKKGEQLYTEWLQKVQMDQEKDTDLCHHVALAYNNRGQLKYLAVDFDGAVVDYTKALELNPELPCSYYNRGTIHYRMGYFERAAIDLEKAVQLSPDTEEFKIGLEKCRDELKNNGT